MIPYQKIVVTLDGSELAQAALAHAEALAQPLAAELTLLRVVPNLAEEIRAAEPVLFEGTRLDVQQQKLVDEATHWLQRQVDQMRHRHVNAKLAVEVGQAPKQIVQYAQANNTDVIVMSTHGYSGFQRWLVGSVAQKVSATAPCAVLLVRAGG
jgi:nucleotide-binding universal stress UspA family protein